MAADPRCSDPRVLRLICFFETLTPQSLSDLGDVYTPDAQFKDPFNDVQGEAAIRRIFEHMFSVLESPRFVVRDAIVQDEQCFLSWDFVFRLRRLGRQEQVIRGGSQLRLASDGRIRMHRDYWDAAEELYEKLPGLGALMRWLKRRVNA